MKTKGADGECIDCFIGDHPESTLVFAIDQLDAHGAYDETKIMLGFRNEQEARAGYISAYSKGWKCGPIKALTMPQFKKWLEEGRTGEPIDGQPIMLSTAHAPAGYTKDRPFMPGRGKNGEVQEHATALETAIGRKNATTQARQVDRADAQDQADRMDQAERQAKAPAPVAPERHVDTSNDAEVQKIIEAGRAGDKTGANELYKALRKKRKWSDDQNERMVAHIMGKIKEPVEEEPEDNPLALSQASVSTAVREQALKDAGGELERLRGEINRLFPLSDFGK